MHFPHLWVLLWNGVPSVVLKVKMIQSQKNLKTLVCVCVCTCAHTRVRVREILNFSDDIYRLSHG